MDNALILRLRRRIYGHDSRIEAPENVSPGTTKWLLGDIVRTHANLRLLIGLFALFFPVVLLVIGSTFGLDMPGSMSEYYWHPYQPGFLDDKITYVVRDAPVRVFFVGGLYAIGVFLIGYRGYTKGENHLHTLAGICAIAVGTLPMNPCGTDIPVKMCEVAKLGNGLYVLPWVHGACAIGLFGFLAIAIWRYSDITLNRFGNVQWTNRLRWLYRALAVMMIALPATIALTYLGFLKALLPSDHKSHYIYWMEICAIVAFGLFWLIKTSEIRLSEYDRMLVSNIEPPSPPADIQSNAIPMINQVQTLP